MTVRSVELIATADVILHDRLIPPGRSTHARDDAELVYVGKRPGDAAMAQREIEELMVGPRPRRPQRRPPEGRRSRSSSAAAARRPRRWPQPRSPSRWFPASRRASRRRPTRGSRSPTVRTRRAVAFVTGHEDPAKDETALDWEALARFPGTLVLYMGVGRLPARSPAA